jgi:hypothetical protein
VPAAVVTVSNDVSAVVPVIETDVGERLHPGRVGFERVLVTAQVNATVPVKEFDGVTEIVEVLPVVAPGATVRLAGEAERAKLVFVPQEGHSQKSPQPVMKQATSGAAASNNRVQLPIFIAAPLAPHSGHAIFEDLLTGYRLGAHPVPLAPFRTHALDFHPSNDAAQQEFACRAPNPARCALRTQSSPRATSW